jgi:hypothetical protein
LWWGLGSGGRGGALGGKPPPRPIVFFAAAGGISSLKRVYCFLQTYNTDKDILQAQNKNKILPYFVLHFSKPSI